jgi:hypothetical protein
MFAAFVLSSGRCGTQWIGNTIQEIYGDLAVSVHEPIGVQYRPRKLLGAVDPEKIEGSDVILQHLQQIEGRLEGGGVTPPLAYIEAGWPCFPAVPYLANRFRGRIKFIHLFRHPIFTASSMVTHGYYDPNNPGIIFDLALLTPFDKGVNFPEYQDVWEDLSPFEKCLYLWAEINTFSLEQQKRLDAPWLTICFEDLFSPKYQYLENLLNFLKLPVRTAAIKALGVNKDSYRFRKDTTFDSQIIEKHPIILNVAESLGYKEMDVTEQALRRRYSSFGLKNSKGGHISTADGRKLIRDSNPEMRMTRRSDPCPCGSGKKYKRCHGMV